MSYNETEIPLMNDTKTLLCEITKADVDNMFELYDSGMCDVTTQNAAVIALRRQIKPHHKVVIHRSGCHRFFICEIDGLPIKLSDDLVDLFDRFESGVSPVGFCFEADIPSDLLSNSNQKERRDEQVLRSQRLIPGA